MVERKKVYLTKKQNERYHEIRKRLWKMYEEEKALRAEIMVMGITHDPISGIQDCDIVVTTH
jgi:hypothetical protein